MQPSMSLEYERSSEPLLILAKQLFLNKELYLSAIPTAGGPASCRAAFAPSLAEGLRHEVMNAGAAAGAGS